MKLQESTVRVLLVVLELVFVIGMFGSAVVLVLTTISDLKAVLHGDETSIEPGQSKGTIGVPPSP